MLRVGVVGLMIAAMLIGTRRSEWAQQSVLIALYAGIALCSLVLAFAPSRAWVGMGPLVGMRRLEPFAFTAIDVVALTGYQMLSTDGIYPLLIMTLLPVLVGLDVSTRRAAVVLAFTLVGFALAVVEDPVMVRAIGWPEAVFQFALYAFLCGTALVVVRIEERHAHSVVGLSALREELLAQTMTASEELQRRISNPSTTARCRMYWPRQELIELELDHPDDERVSRALATCRARRNGCGKPLSSCTRQCWKRSGWGRGRAARRFHGTALGHQGHHRHRLPDT